MRRSDASKCVVNRTSRMQTLFSDWYSGVFLPTIFSAPVVLVGRFSYISVSSGNSYSFISCTVIVSDNSCNILLGHNAQHRTRTIATQAAWSVCVFVGHNRETDKTAEPTEMPFGMWTRAWELKKSCEYNPLIRARRRCGLLSNYVDYLLPLSLHRPTVVIPISCSRKSVVSDERFTPN